MSFGANKSNQKGSTTGSTTGQDTTSGTTNFNTTSTPTNPDWVSNLVQNQAGADTTLAGTNPTQYIAAASPLQQQAAAGASNLSGTPWAFDGASDATRGVVNAKAPSIANNISSFMDPYLNSVVAATSADLDHSDGIARANDDLALAGSGAFGGSGAALTKSATEGQLSRARATSIGGLESQGYSQALGGATAQAQLQQQQQAQKLAAAQQLANLGTQFESGQRANIATQDQAAAPIQAISQATAQAPVDFQTVLTQLMQGLPLSLFQGQTQAGNENQNTTENQTGTSQGTSQGTTTGFNAGIKFGGGK